MGLQNPDSAIYLNLGSSLLDSLRRKQSFSVTWVALELWFAHPHPIWVFWKKNNRSSTVPDQKYKLAKKGQRCPENENRPNLGRKDCCRRIMNVERVGEGWKYLRWGPREWSLVNEKWESVGPELDTETEERFSALFQLSFLALIIKSEQKNKSNPIETRQ